MKKRTGKKLLSFAIATAVLLVVFFCGLHEKPAAVCSAYAIAVMQHLDQGFPILQSVRYNEVFDYYDVTFTLAGSGEERVVSLFPKCFPVVVQRNTFNPLERPGLPGTH